MAQALRHKAMDVSSARPINAIDFTGSFLPQEAFHALFFHNQAACSRNDPHCTRHTCPGARWKRSGQEAQQRSLHAAGRRHRAGFRGGQRFQRHASQQPFRSRRQPGQPAARHDRDGGRGRGCRRLHDRDRDIRECRSATGKDRDQRLRHRHERRYRAGEHDRQFFGLGTALRRGDDRPDGDQGRRQERRIDRILKADHRRLARRQENQLRSAGRGHQG
ncbi:hypothetical protein D3C80_1016300 [compost metagenome]